MEKTFITIIKNIEKDLENNLSLYEKSKLKTSLGQFQNKILDLRKKDEDLQISLQGFSIAGLKKLINDLDLHLLTIPRQKFKLISTLNSLIIQEGKKNQFMKFAESQKSQIKTRSTAKKLSTSPVENEKIRNKWLTHNSLETLSKEILNFNMKDLREIVLNWGIKGRSKQEIADKTISYIKRMRNLSKFGT